MHLKMQNVTFLFRKRFKIQHIGVFFSISFPWKMSVKHWWIRKSFKNKSQQKTQKFKKCKGASKLRKTRPKSPKMIKWSNVDSCFFTLYDLCGDLWIQLTYILWQFFSGFPLAGQFLIAKQHRKMSSNFYIEIQNEIFEFSLRLTNHPVWEMPLVLLFYFILKASLRGYPEITLVVKGGWRGQGKANFY